MPEPQERILSALRLRGGWLFLTFEDGSELPLPPVWEWPDGLPAVGARVVTHEVPEAWTVSVAGFVVICVDADGNPSREEQRPAVLGGPPIVMWVEGGSRAWSLGKLVTKLPGLPPAVTAIVDKIRYTLAGQLPLLEMLEQHPWLPFVMEPLHKGGLGDTRLYYYGDRWNLPIEVIRLWLAAELKVELDESDGPDDRSIGLPESFFTRIGAVRQLELALLRLGNWRLDDAVREWVDGLEA